MKARSELDIGERMPFAHAIAAPIAEKKKPAAEALQAGRSLRGLLIYINAEYASAFE